MNAKDCDSIAYALAQLVLGECGVPETVDVVCSLDPRVREEFDGYTAVIRRDAAIDAKFEEIMCQRFGPNWALLKAVTDEVTKQVLDEAIAAVPPVD